MSNYFYYPLYNSVTTTSNTHKHYPHHHHHRLLYWVACVVIAIQLQILFWLTLNIEKSQTVLPTPQQGQLFFFFRQSVAPSHPSNVETHTDISLPKYITRNTHICVCAPILYVRHTIRVTYISHANFKRQKNLGNNLKVFTSRLTN